MPFPLRPSGIPCVLSPRTAAVAFRPSPLYTEAVLAWGHRPFQLSVFMWMHHTTHWAAAALMNVHGLLPICATLHPAYARVQLATAAARITLLAVKPLAATHALAHLFSLSSDEVHQLFASHLLPACCRSSQLCLRVLPEATLRRQYSFG